MRRAATQTRPPRLMLHTFCPGSAAVSAAHASRKEGKGKYSIFCPQNAGIQRAASETLALPGCHGSNKYAALAVSPATLLADISSENRSEGLLLGNDCWRFSKPGFQGSGLVSRFQDALRLIIFAKTGWDLENCVRKRAEPVNSDSFRPSTTLF